jgi:hypothetical protein
MLNLQTRIPSVDDNLFAIFLEAFCEILIARVVDGSMSDGGHSVA